MLTKFQYKFWRRSLAKYVKENNMLFGVELGVKAGQSYNVCLKLNPNLVLIGIDNWEVLQNSPYDKNNTYEIRCQQIAAKFGSRAILKKADVIELAKDFKDYSFDFIFYDLFNHRTSTVDFHKQVLHSWFPKLKPGCQMIGRDFHEPDIAEAINELGYSWSYCKVGKKLSPRLGYIEAN